MYWKTRYGILTKKHIASKDIPVKKAFIVKMGNGEQDKIRSLFYCHYVWTQGRLYKSYLGFVNKLTNKNPLQGHHSFWTTKTYWTIESGFHSAKNIQIREKATVFAAGIGRYLVMSSDKKDYSIEYPIGFYCYDQIKILNCVIPKGSEYYLNEYGEYVSDQLIILPNQ